MLLHNVIVAAYPEGFSGVYIYGTEQENIEITNIFMDLFESNWEKAMRDLEDDYGMPCDEELEDMPIPASVCNEGHRVHIHLDPLFMQINDGNRVETSYGYNALRDTLDTIMEQYPESKYEGIVAYEWYDEHCGDIENYEISSYDLPEDNELTYDFIKDALKIALTDDNYKERFWEVITESIEDWDDEFAGEADILIRDFSIYGASKEDIDKLQNIIDTNC